jgi:Lipocalin-like domain
VQSYSQAGGVDLISDQEESMKIRLLLALLVIGFAVRALQAVAQSAKELVGTWTLVSITLEQNGKKTDFYGSNPQGQVTYAPNGRVSLIIARSDLPQFASKNRKAGTPEENKAVVQGEHCLLRYVLGQRDR